MSWCPPVGVEVTQAGERIVLRLATFLFLDKATNASWWNPIQFFIVIIYICEESGKKEEEEGEDAEDEEGEEGKEGREGWGEKRKREEEEGEKKEEELPRSKGLLSEMQERVTGLR